MIEAARPTELWIEHFAGQAAIPQKKIVLTEFMIKYLHANDTEIHSLVRELCISYESVMRDWLHDFSFIIPNLSDQDYPIYAQHLVELATSLALEAEEKL